MLSLENQKKIIEKFVRTNKNYRGNEDLFDDFCSESMQKSYLIFNSISNEQKIENYISKVVHTSILKVLKEYGRVRRADNKYVSSREASISDYTDDTPYSRRKKDYSRKLRKNYPDDERDYERSYDDEPDYSYDRNYGGSIHNDDSRHYDDDRNTAGRDYDEEEPVRKKRRRSKYQEDYEADKNYEPEYEPEYSPDEYAAETENIDGSSQEMPRELSSSFVLELPDPKESAEEALITKDCLQRISDAVCIINKEVPAQQYLSIFYYRYFKGMKQSEIAENLGLSQSEISKRLMKLSKLISNFMDGGKK